MITWSATLLAQVLKFPRPIGRIFSGFEVALGGKKHMSHWDNIGIKAYKNHVSMTGNSSYINVMK